MQLIIPVDKKKSLFFTNPRTYLTIISTHIIEAVGIAIRSTWCI